MVLYDCCRWIVRTALTLLYRVEPVHAERVPRDGPVVLCGNHRSTLDPPIVACYLRRRVRFMAKAELFGIPGFAALIRALGAFPVNRGGLTMETMKTAIKVLKDGSALVIFPEGTRQRTGRLGEGKKGAASMALRSGASIVPVAIAGSYKLFRGMKVVYGQPFDAREAVEGLPPSEQADALTRKIMSEIQRLLDRHC